MTTSSATVRFPDGSRWSCCSSGDCCRGFDFGPVEPEIISGLQSRDIESHWAPAAEAPWHERRTDPKGGEAFFLTKRDEHCVFLRDDNLCAVHALFGAEAKPAFCREYPFHVVEDTRGLVVVARADCGGFHRSFLDGQPIAEQVDAVLALPAFHPRRQFVPDQVVILPTAAVSVDDWMALEAVLLPQLDRQRSAPEAAVAHLRFLLHDLVNRKPPTPDSSCYRSAMEALLRMLATTLDRLAGDQQPDAAYGGDLAREVAQAATRALDGLSAPLPPLDPHAVDYLHLILRSDLMSKQFQVVGGVPCGLGLHLLSATLARLGTNATHGGPLTPTDLGRVMPKWKRLSLHGAILEALRHARPALADLFLHVG
ncbi:MAG: YkgJ family cysteine cluster protein [Deltaproteobacteria bacterium]|nr:YkgJ family cysteine cluster protein [Deltaproteobacteria bacterium]